MKNQIKNDQTSSKTNFTVNIAITYVALFVVMMFGAGRYANAGMSVGSKGVDDNHFASDFLTTLTVVGQGELSWLGFSVYRASLWTKDGNFQGLEGNKPIALEIIYQRNIEAADLAERTVEEWERLGVFDGEKRDLWGKRLAKIWPDVKPQDSITTLITPDQRTRFYHNDKLLTVLNEPEFGRALLSIWLDPATSEPELREKLIGKGEDE